MNFEELISDLTPRHGQTWGKWQLDTDLYTLTHSDHDYEIRLDEINTCAQMLDWIFQLRKKTWITNEDMGNLTQAFEDIFRPQSSMCSGGGEVPFDAKKYLDVIVKFNNRK